LEFFQRREHVLIPPAAFVDTGKDYPWLSSGIEPFSAYFSGELDPLGDIYPPLGRPLGALSVVSSERCFRPEDADLVGDSSHLTSFEMLGAYTFGGYKKQTAIKVANDFLKNLNLFMDYVTVFSGESGWGGLPFDKDAEYMWKELGVTYIQRLGLKENFWGPAGTGGVCGPSSEVYLKDMGVWSIVFLDYYFSGNHEELVSVKSLRKIKRLNVHGIASVMGLERLTAAADGKANVFETDIFEGLFLPLEAVVLTEQQKRVIIDHLRTVCFFMDGRLAAGPRQLFNPVLNNFLRRLFVYERLFKIPGGLFEEIVEKIIRLYANDFKNPADLIRSVNDIIRKERSDFAEIMAQGLKELLKKKSKGSLIDALTALYFFENFGLPYESIKEFGGPAAKNLTREDFEKELIGRGLVSGKKPEEKSGVGSRLKGLWNRIP